MTRRVTTVLGCYALGVVVLAVAVWSGNRPVRTAVADPVKMLEPLPEARMYDVDDLYDAADTIVATDPFRLTRQAAAGPQPVSAAASSPPPLAPRLQLTVTGVIGGPPWHAVLSGIPGHETGMAVGVGDTVGELRIRSIRHDSVVVRFRDSSWALTLKH